MVARAYDALRSLITDIEIISSTHTISVPHHYALLRARRRWRLGEETTSEVLRLIDVVSGELRRNVRLDGRTP